MKLSTFEIKHYISESKIINHLIFISMKKILFVIFLLTSISYSQVQRDTGPLGNMLSNNIDDFALQRIDKVYAGEYSDKIRGDVYLFDDWPTCVVRTNLKEEGLNFSLPCNYNLFTDKFEMKVDNEVYFLKKEVILEVIKQEQSFIPNPNMTTPGSKNYVEVLANGNKFDLVRIYELKIKDVQSSTSLGLYEKKIAIKDELYFMTDTNMLIEVPNSKKKIYKLLELTPAEKDQISGNIKRVENLKKAVEMI